MSVKYNTFPLYNPPTKQYNEYILRLGGCILKYTIQTKLYRIAIHLEILVGLCILIAIATATVGLFLDIRLSSIILAPETLQSYLTTAMTIIIGIEFVKMIFSYTIDTVVEVMMLAVARQMVLTHTSPIENLITIVSVALLFVIRKYLFVRQLDHQEHSRDYPLPFFRRKGFKNTHPQDINSIHNKSTIDGKEEETTHATP